MRRRLKAALVALAVFPAFLVCAGIAAQQPASRSSGPAANPGKKQPEEVVAKFKYIRQSLESGKKVSLLKGATFTHGDTVLTSDLVNVDQDANTAVSPGKITVTNPECDITGDKGSADFNKRLAIIEGNVVMNVKPKPEGTTGQKPDKDSVREKFRQPTTITCPKLEYKYRAKIATGTGGVVFKQEKRTATADKVVYDEKNELLTLIGNVHAVDEDGQTFSAPDKVVMSLKKGNEWMEAPNATATFKIDLEGDEEEQKAQ